MRAKNPDTGLTDKQERFAELVAYDPKISDSEAYRQAYNCERMKPATISRQAHTLKHDPKVAARIAQLREQRREAAKIDAAYVLRQAVKLHERCMQEIEPFTDVKGNHLHDDLGRPLYVFDSKGAAQALKLVGDHVDVSAFKKHLAVGGEPGAPVETVTLDPKEYAKTRAKMLADDDC